MAREIERGQIWRLDLPKPDKRRPVLVLTRPSLIPLLHTVTVVAITSTLRGSPTEVAVGVDEGLKRPSCANLCNLFTVEKRRLRRFVGTVGRERMAEVCEALRVATGCD